MSRFLKEPLVHFLVVGALLFVLFALVNDGNEVRESDDKIVISAGRIEQLAGVFERTRQRPPRPNELEGLVEDFVLEEVYYRTAIEMGIDRDDTGVRRRLRQKLEFLTDDAASLVEPGADDLASYLAANPDSFREEPTYTFEHRFFRPSNHGGDEELAKFLDSQLAKLSAGEDVPGDVTVMQSVFQDESARRVDGALGAGFAEALDSLALGEWSGPVKSTYGMHLVKLDARDPGKVPELEEIRDTVEREWANAERENLREQVNQRLREKYEVVIEWPEEK